MARLRSNLVRFPHETPSPLCASERGGQWRPLVANASEMERVQQRRKRRTYYLTAKPIRVELL